MALVEIINTEKPDAVAVEDLFFSTNAKTAMIVGQARGVILLAAAQQDIPLTAYTPLQVKSAVTGFGHAEKKQVEKMTMLQLQMTKKPKLDDTTDALAIALTHAFSYQLEKAKGRSH
jgi:crossover junction endodeoxyribonuclease RuvC